MNPTYAQAIVVGASSGIGESIARQLATQGTQVVLVARREVELKRVAAEIAAAGGKATTIAHDVQDLGGVSAAFEKALGALGGLDLFVYAAGILEPVEENELDPGKDTRMLAVNLVGAVAWTDLAAAHFMAQRKGTLLGISSIAGVRGRRGNPVYGASKAGMTAYYEGLRNRLTRYGVDVVTIKPGFVDTDMLKQSNGKKFWVVSADEAARQSLRVAEEGGSREVFVPARWGLVAAVIRMIPSTVFRRMNF